MMSLPDLKCPESRLIVEKSHLDHPQSRHLNVIREHPFNYMLDTIIPNCAEPPHFEDGLSSKYYEAKIQLSSLIHIAFIEAFIKRGELQLISSQNRIDNDDVICVTPTGSLLLHLTNLSYQQLGLIGKPSQYSKKTKQKRYVVEIDLTASFFRPGKNNYERARKCLANHTQVYDVIFTWKPTDERIAPISVLRYFKSLGYQSKEMSPRIDTQLLETITSCPVIDAQQLEADNSSSVHYSDFWEWLGAISCGITLRAKEKRSDTDEFLSTLSCPSPHQKVDHVYKESITGMASVSDITARFLQLRLQSTVGALWLFMVLPIRRLAGSASSTTI
ncbi:ribonuclease P protein subunit p40-like isoform X2 [Watersipora subatra]|uniref:ribonuclease P protein subunit p40-like isoform X2 n=1 Tax=Watersipora subatra TaxID=2589382 RepID=UPI00355B1670